jgi:hypothetical protein
MKAYKGFNKNLMCRDFQYVEGETYKHESEVVKCTSRGFHACEYPIDVFSYYNPSCNVFHIVEMGGQIDKSDDNSKLASAEITIKASITIPEMVQRSVDWIMSKTENTETNTGYQSAATNTGNRSAATNTGDQSAATNTGNRSAATNTGDYSAATNTGDYSAATNTGNRSAATNTGYQSAATNTGNYSAVTNTGNYSAATNTGNYSAATVEGEKSVALASGHGSKANGALGCAIFLVYRDNDYNIIHARGEVVDGKKVKPNTFYSLDKNGELVEHE